MRFNKIISAAETRVSRTNTFFHFHYPLNHCWNSLSGSSRVGRKSFYTLCLIRVLLRKKCTRSFYLPVRKCATLGGEILGNGLTILNRMTIILGTRDSPTFIPPTGTRQVTSAPDWCFQLRYWNSGRRVGEETVKNTRVLRFCLKKSFVWNNRVFCNIPG